MRLVHRIFCLSLLAQAACRTEVPQAQQLPVDSELLAEGLDSPTGIVQARDERLFILEQPGRLRIWRGGALLPSPFLDITGLVENKGSEQGLLGVAFHPRYPDTPYFFVYYTARDTGAVTLARYAVAPADPDRADPQSARVLLSIPHTNARNHNGGQLQFNPGDGYLYMGVGDGGKGCDATGPGCNAQRPSLLGKLLRLDVDRSADGPPFYSAPPDNPFIASGEPMSLVWALGLRNPWRFSFDRRTHDLYIGDVGQGRREEIDFQPAASEGGVNYGWPFAEGTACGTCPATLAHCPDPASACAGFQAPWHDYGRDQGICVIGGFVYRGERIPSLQGLYLFGDYGTGRIWAKAQGQAPLLLSVAAPGLTSFGEDAKGELYFTLASGQIRRLIPAAAEGSGAEHGDR